MWFTIKYLVVFNLIYNWHYFYNMEVIIFKNTDAVYDKALQLRTDVLRTPLGLKFTAEELKKDESDTHFGLFEDDKILACLTLTKCADNKMKMRQVAVHPDFQKKGLGKKLAAESEIFAREKGFKIMFCHARKTAVPFYESMGYTIVGDEFSEVNIPHYLMEKRLDFFESV